MTASEQMWSGGIVVFDDGHSRSRYVAREIAKAMPKTLNLAPPGYPRQIPSAKAIACFGDREAADRFCQSLAGIDGEYQRRVAAARDAKNRAVERLVELAAAARGAQ